MPKATDMAALAHIVHGQPCEHRPITARLPTALEKDSS